MGTSVEPFARSIAAYTDAAALIFDKLCILGHPSADLGSGGAVPIGSWKESDTDSESCANFGAGHRQMVGETQGYM